MTETHIPRRKPRLPSLLRPWQRTLLTVGLALAAFVFANTLYLLLNRLSEAAGWEFLAAGESTLPVLYQVMVLGHTAAGLLLALLMLAFSAVHLPRVWRRRDRPSVLSGILFVTSGLVLTVTGLFILTASASDANRWAWWAHVAAAALAPLGYGLHRWTSHTRPGRRHLRRFAGAVAAAALLLVAWHGFTRTDGEPVGSPAPSGEGRAAGPGAVAGARARDVSDFLDRPFVPAAFVPPESSFFPSAATTASGGRVREGFLTAGPDTVPADSLAGEVERRGFVADAAIGAETCARCHPDVVAQWRGSAHRFASFNNPFYEATVQEMRATADETNPWVEEHLAAFPDRVDGVARAKSKWCAGCHDPALLFTGRMGGPVDRSARAAQAGLTCLACHAVDTIHGVTGNGNYNLADRREDPYIFDDAARGTPGAFLHDAAVRARPSAHRRRMRKPVFGTSRFCATCHKVSLREPVNNYRWLRGQDEYDAWHDSGISRNAARTFYLPGRARRCQDCHMPRVPAPRGDVAAENGTVRSHRFPGANTALPHVRGDTASLRRTEAFLRDDRLRVDLFALRRGGPGNPDLQMPLDRDPPELRPGEEVTLDVVVRNLGVGHTFPGGTNDSNEGWLQVSLLNGRGTLLGRSGEIGPGGHLEPRAHAYKAVVLDRDGHRIHRRNAHDVHVTAAKNVIGPGTAEVAHYGFRVPESAAGGEIVLRARLLWRKFDRAYTEFAYRANPGGFRRLDTVPALPVTEIAADEVVLPVSGARGRGGVDAAGTGHGRATDSGRGDAPPGDGPTGGSEATGVGTDRGRGTLPAGPGARPAWVRFNDYGIGLLLEGNTRLARRAFRRVAELSPDRIDGPLNLARTALRDGELERAYRQLERVEEIHGGDARAAWVWGRALQEDGQYADAAAAYRRVLEDFPRDRAAWRNLGRVLYSDRRYRRALEALDRVLEIDPEDRVAHYHRMLCYRALGRTAAAGRAEAAFQHYRIDESARVLTREYLAKHPGANLMAQSIHTHRLSRPSGDAAVGGPDGG